MIFHQAENSLSNYSYNIARYTDEFINYHFHKNLELIFVLEGSIQCTINSNAYTLSAGEFGLCLPFDIHCYEPCGNCKYWVLVFSEDFVSIFSKTVYGHTGNGFSFRLQKETEAYVRMQLVENSNPSVYQLKSCLYAICEQYLHTVELIQNPREQTEKIGLIVDYIANHHGEHITLLDIAKKFGYDYNYMSRNFKSIFKITFKEFLNLYRLETAIDLLNNTELSVTEIAYESGFQSIRSFHDFFKKKMDVSPAQYRKASR